MPPRSILVEHWRELDGAVHPQDAPVFDRSSHSFNLDWPPPAYIGDVLNARFILLMMNGGYDRQITPLEFPDAAAIERHIDMLRNPRPIDPQSVSPYYGTGNYGQYIASGRLALVNACAYRSGKLSEEGMNRRLAENLPSVQLHRRWLREELIPQALSGTKVIIAHRNRLWKLRQDEFRHAHIIFTRSGVSPNLPHWVLDSLEQ